MEHLQRIIQESVDGKEVVLAHVIASPAPDIYDRIGVPHGQSIGILTLSPEETSIIAAGEHRVSRSLYRCCGGLGRRAKRRDVDAGGRSRSS